jgi:UDP-N-acetylmuramate: L-alanyl-gamma-D-glutamyl-meso-diaminopimelate ligase
VATYGRTAEADWSLGEVTVRPPRIAFEVLRDGRRFGRFETGLPGEHNLLNTLAAVAVAHRAGLGVEAIASGIAGFKGVRRRQEIRGTADGVTVVDDFAHHPTAVLETIRALKPFSAGGRLVAVFEPRTNTSMRKIFQAAYPPAFDGADLVCIREPSALHKVPEAERFSARALVADIEARGIPARYFADTDGIVDFLTREALRGDWVLVMSNGGFDGIHQRLLAAFSRRSRR